MLNMVGQEFCYWYNFKIKKKNHNKMISRKTQPEKTLSKLLKCVLAFRMGLDYMTSSVSFQHKLVYDSKKKKKKRKPPKTKPSGIFIA